MAVNDSNYFQQTISGDLFSVFHGTDLSRLYKRCHTLFTRYKHLALEARGVWWHLYMIIAYNTANFELLGRVNFFGNLKKNMSDFVVVI